MDIHLLDDFSQFCVEITVRFPTIAAISQALVYNSLNALADYIEIQRDGANLEVRDNGHGISPDLLRQIDNKADRRTLCSLKRISELEVITFTAEFSC